MQALTRMSDALTLPDDSPSGAWPIGDTDQAFGIDAEDFICVDRDDGGDDADDDNDGDDNDDDNDER